MDLGDIFIPLSRYSDAMEIVWAVIDMAFSSAVITPGVTTCDDVGWWMWEAVRAAGYTCDFMPDVGVQRSGAGDSTTLFGDTIIREGAVLMITLGPPFRRLLFLRSLLVQGVRSHHLADCAACSLSSFC